MSRIIEVIRDSFLILRNVNVPSRLHLLYSYLWASFLSILHDRLFRFETISFLSFEISFNSYTEFMHTVREIFVLGFYFFKSPKTDPVIIDCGANIGMATLYFKYLYPEARILAFEPVKSTFDVFQKNVEQNSLSNISLHNSAVFDRAGRVPVYTRGDWSHGASVVREQLGETSASAEKLSELISGDVDLLKMDIESSELRVLKELEVSGKLKSINAIIVEVHYLYDFEENSTAELLRVLEKGGFDYSIFLQRGNQNAQKRAM